MQDLNLLMDYYDDEAVDSPVYHGQEEHEPEFEEMDMPFFGERDEEKDEFEKDLDWDDFEELDEDDDHSFARYGFGYDF